jgi:hypothetical protein
MTDAEIRYRLLTIFYELRHNNDGRVPTSDMNLSGSEPVSRQAIGNVCQQLADARLIEWKPLTGANEQLVIGMAIITGHGVDVVERRRESSIDIRFPGTDQREVAAAAALVQKEAESKSRELEHLPEALIPPTSAQESRQKPAEVVTLKPTFMGMSIDLKELWRRFAAWRKNQK